MWWHKQIRLGLEVKMVKGFTNSRSGSGFLASRQEGATLLEYSVLIFAVATATMVGVNRYQSSVSSSLEHARLMLGQEDEMSSFRASFDGSGNDTAFESDSNTNNQEMSKDGTSDPGMTDGGTEGSFGGEDQDQDIINKNDNDDGTEEDSKSPQDPPSNAPGGKGV
jgi:hypothetical protein